MLDPWTPPTEIAEFRLERRLGHGATSDVWLARDTLLDRVVALKIANAPALHDVRTRFRVEARAVAKMQHPNLLAIHHVGEIADRPFLVTEFLSGKNLHELDRPVDPDRVVSIGIDLARGLSAAHNAGVLHRDIKPANAFLCDDGVAKLLDFGLAKLSDAPIELAQTTSSNRDPRSPSGRHVSGSAVATESPGALDATQPDLTSSDQMAGTPLYMAPETWRNEIATRPTDLYSLGALLFELLAGRPPIATTTIAELHRRATVGAIDALSTVAPSVPAALAAIVTRCLRLDPSERPTADEVCDALARLAPARRSTQAEALDDPRENPYRGLLSFGPEHRALFFGRDAEAAAVTAELRANPFVLVAGSSGAGKSSLVRAGVVPRVEKGALGGALAWRAVIVVPGRRPTDALAQAMAGVLDVDEAEVREQLAKSPAWLADEMRAARARVLLVIDQLEEIWTLAEAREREAFFEIVAAIAASAPTVRVVATLRADFLGRLEDMGELQAHALKSLIVLRPMAPDGLRRAIVEPALRRGVTIEDPLVMRLVEHAEGGSLPLLEFALGALYARRDEARGTIGLGDLDALGGVEGALATHADAVLARLPTAQRREARTLLLALVTVERTRWRREERDLVGAGEEDARAALSALVDARLVVAGAGEHFASYEVAHEALLHGWPTLRGWLDEESAAREVAERVHRAATEWERAGGASGAKSALFGERQLGELDALQGRALDARDAAFVLASRAAVRSARVRTWSLRVGAPVLALLAAGAIAIGIRWSEQRQARAFVAAQLADAEPLLREVKADDAEVEAARAAAFARFDAGDKVEGEARWRTALELAQRESNAFVAASEPLGLALARAPLDPTARARAADLAYLWLLAAERDHEPDVARDLVARIAQLDDDGSRRARIDARAHLRVSTRPAGARVILHTVHVDGDGHRVEDEGRAIDLGAPVDLVPGSYLLEASAPDRYSTRYPLALARAEEARVDLPLPRADSVARGFVFVPAGTSLVGATDAEAVRTSLLAEPEHAVHVDAFLIGEHEVTFAEYLEFLAAQSPDEREARRPRAVGVELTYDGDGAPMLTLGATKTRAGEPVCLPKRSVRRCQTWLRFPVAAVAQDDARAYAAWLARTRLPGARLCSEREWERAARGADGRLFPHGDALLAGDANYDATYATDDAQMGLDEVGSFPNDRSPFGVFDLAGNVTEWLELRYAIRTARGGIWFRSTDFARASSPDVRLDERYEGAGVRVCASAPAP